MVFLDRKAPEFEIPNVKLHIFQITRTGRLPAAISLCLWKSDNPRIIGQKLRYYCNNDAIIIIIMIVFRFLFIFIFYVEVFRLLSSGSG